MMAATGMASSLGAGPAEQEDRHDAVRAAVARVESHVTAMLASATDAATAPRGSTPTASVESHTEFGAKFEAGQTAELPAGGASEGELVNCLMTILRKLTQQIQSGVAGMMAPSSGIPGPAAHVDFVAQLESLNNSMVTRLLSHGPGPPGAVECP
jgi:hypothetical protein